MKTSNQIFYIQFVSQKVVSGLKDFSSLMNDVDSLKLMEVYRNADSDQIEMVENNLQFAKDAKHKRTRLNKLTSPQSLRTKPSSSSIDIPKETQNSPGSIRSKGTMADLTQLPASRSSDLAYATSSHLATVKKHAKTLKQGIDLIKDGPWKEIKALSGNF